MTTHFERARLCDLPELQDLLATNDLPTEGLADCFPDVFVLRTETGIGGMAALEWYAEGALLRSVAVDTSQRGTGLGRKLVEHLLGEVARQHVGQVYLLTTTAADFFAHMGFRIIPRTAVAPSVQQAAEFTTLCPSSATVMVKTLGTFAGASV